MGWFGKIAWALGMWICGAFVMSMFGTQIRIASKCAKKILDRFAKMIDVDYYLDVAPCRKYLNSVILKNVIIITVVSAIILLLAPSIGITFYFIGMLFSWVISVGATGITQQNVEETATVFLRFSKAEKASDVTDFAFIIAQQIQNEAEVKAMFKKR